MKKNTDLTMNLAMKIILSFILFICVLLPDSYAQNNEARVIEISVAKLQQKVLLSDKQAADISSLLTRNVDSFRESSTKDQALNSAKTKIESMLDDRQKSKYEIIKNDWWDNFSKDISQAAKQ